MADVFKRLAKKLDEFPMAFPATENGIELRILEKIFSREEAEMALDLQPIPESAEDIADRLGRPVEETRTFLDMMAEKGQISSRTRGGKQLYALTQFMPGFYEYQVYRKDKELCELADAYFPTLMKIVGGFSPESGRTIPINAMIKDESRIEKYEDVRRIIEAAKSFTIGECSCRKEKALLGHQCEHTLEGCLHISNEENAFDYFKLGDSRIISKKEALDLIEKFEEEGLVHQALPNAKEGLGAICNCCPCCCATIKITKELGLPGGIAKSNFIALIDQEFCNECGICKEERCPMDAINQKEETYSVLTDRCIGCGACAVACPTECITLVRRPDSEQEEPPDNAMDWFSKRVSNMGIESK